MFPFIRPRRCSGTNTITVVINSGIMIAVPLACRMRPIRRTKKSCDNAATSVPVVKKDIAAIYIGLVLKRCRRNPVVGMMTAIVNMYAVLSH